MVTRDGERELQKQWFRAKLASEKQKSDVQKHVKDGKGGFVLIDARDRASYGAGHLPGAISMPLEDFERVIETLDHDAEYVTYCWAST
jgi:rhodanese-related sulfurtransferase